MYCYVVIFGVLRCFHQIVVSCSIALCCNLYGVVLAYFVVFFFFFCSRVITVIRLIFCHSGSCMVLYCVLWHYMVLTTVPCCVVWFCIVLDGVASCGIVSHGSVWDGIMLHCVVLLLQGIVLRHTGVCCRSMLCYSVSGGRWQTLCHDADFASYSTLAVSPDTTYLAVASILGHVRVLHRGQEGELKKWKNNSISMYNS